MQVRVQWRPVRHGIAGAAMPAGVPAAAVAEAGLVADEDLVSAQPVHIRRPDSSRVNSAPGRSKSRRAAGHDPARGFGSSPGSVPLGVERGVWVSTPAPPTLFCCDSRISGIMLPRRTFKEASAMRKNVVDSADGTLDFPRQCAGKNTLK